MRALCGAVLGLVFSGAALAQTFDPRNPGGPPPFDPRSPGSDAFPGTGSGTPGFPGGVPSGAVRSFAPPARPLPPGGVVIFPDGTFWPQPTVIVPRLAQPVPSVQRSWPAHALPPPDWRALLTPPPGAESLRELRMPDGGFWTLGTGIRGDEAIFAGDCWAVPPQEPGALPPGFDGGIVLPRGGRWVPGSALGPRTPIWAWMCGAWTALRLRSP